MRRLLIIAIFLSLAVFGQGGAESQPPAPGPFKETHPPQEKAQSHQTVRQDDKRGTEEFPLFIKTIETESQKTEKDRDIKQHEKETATNWRLMLITGGLLLVAVFQLGFFYWQLNLMRESMQLSKTAANAALSAANAAEKQSQAVILAERAYVRISSCSPGIIFFEESPLACKLQIKNYGETPAHITDIVIQMRLLDRGQLLPEVPDYSRAKIYVYSASFLVRGESIFYNFFDKSITPKEIIKAIKDGEKVLCLYGFVDYTDVFGTRHRGSFGQNYYPANDSRENYTNDEIFKTRNNLTFLMQAGYNFDRPRKDGEGRS